MSSVTIRPRDGALDVPVTEPYARRGGTYDVANDETVHYCSDLLRYLRARAETGKSADRRETSVARPTRYRVATDSTGLIFPPLNIERNASECVCTSRSSAASLRSSGGGQLKPMPAARSLSRSRILRMGNLCPGMPRSLFEGGNADSQITRRYTRPQPGRDRWDQVVAINRNAWSQSIGTGGNHPVRAHELTHRSCGSFRGQKIHRGQDANPG
jgi:hypothetical protein